MLLIRTLLFYVGQSVIIIIFACFVVPLCCLLPFKRRFQLLIPASRLILLWLRITCGISHQIEGLEHIPSQRYGLILSNHQSEWETLYLQTLVRPICTVIKKELLFLPLFGWGLSLLKPIAINRQQKRNALKQIIQQGKTRLRTGNWVLIFPEGTRVPVGKKVPFNKGGAILACDAQVPVLPVVHNAGNCCPSGQFIKRPGVIKIRIGPLIETQGKNMITVHEESTRWIKENMCQLNAR